MNPATSPGSNQDGANVTYRAQRISPSGLYEAAALDCAAESSTTPHRIRTAQDTMMTADTNLFIPGLRVRLPNEWRKSSPGCQAWLAGAGRAPATPLSAESCSGSTSRAPPHALRSLVGMTFTGASFGPVKATLPSTVPPFDTVVNSYAEAMRASPPMIDATISDARSTRPSIVVMRKPSSLRWCRNHSSFVFHIFRFAFGSALPTSANGMPPGSVAKFARLCPRAVTTRALAFDRRLSARQHHDGDAGQDWANVF